MCVPLCARLPACLQEYASSGDKEEVARILRDLAVPFFHHELVKQVGGSQGVAGRGWLAGKAARARGKQARS